MAKSLTKRFGEKLRRIRKEKGITQEELSFRSSLNKNYLSDVERGSRNISIQSVEKIAKGLEISPAELFENDDEQ